MIQVLLHIKNIIKIIHNRNINNKVYENNNFMIIQNKGTKIQQNLHLLLIPKKN